METFTLKYNDYNIATYKEGHGPMQILFLHGAGLDNGMLSWKEVMECLDPNKYTAYTFDYPGYGKSSKVTGGKAPDFYNFYNAVIESVVKQLGLHDFVLAGLSLGGAFAQGYAFLHPDDLRALVLTDPWGITKKMPMHFLTWLTLSKTNLTKTSYKWTGKSRFLAKWSVSYSLIGDKTKITNSLVDEILELCKAPDAAVSMEDYQHNSVTMRGTKPYYMDKLPELYVRTLVVNGEKDPLVNVDDARKAANLIPDAEFYILEGCKHWAQKERPEEYVKLVDEFINRK